MAFETPRTVLNLPEKKRGGIFYGWWVVVACATIAFYGGGIFFYGFSAFFNPIIKDFGWSRAALSGAFSLQRVEGGIAAPIIGWLVDRYGPRRIMLFGVTAGGLGFLLLSQVQSILAFYGAILVISIGLSSAIGSVGMAAVANWFIKKRGRAMGLMMGGVGLSGTMAPFLVWLINRYGWRPTLVILGVGLWVIGIPAAAFVRHRPEQYGYLPDGYEASAPLDITRVEAVVSQGRDGQGSPPPASQVKVVEEADYSAWDALKTPAFWIIPVAMGLSNIKSAAVTVHMIPYLTGVGIPDGMAALVISGMTLLSLSGRLGMGWLADYFDKRYLMACAFGLQFIGIMIFAFVSSPWMLIPFLLTYGPGYGGPIPLRPALQGDYFGRRAFATIQGLMQFVMMFPAMLGPFIAGWVYDVTGSYRAAFIFFAVAIALAIPIILMAKPPVMKKAPPLSKLADEGQAIS